MMFVSEQVSLDGGGFLHSGQLGTNSGQSNLTND